MRSFAIFLFLFSIYCPSALSQNIYIEGNVLNRDNDEAIPFATVYNSKNNKGTITNAEGYFRMSFADAGDTLFIRHIGYDEGFIIIKQEEDFYTIQLRENLRFLNEVTIKPTESEYLFTLIEACRKSAPKDENDAKAYYQLKSFVNQNQVELVEAYYNIFSEGYKINELKLKAGRVGLRLEEDRFFASLESSKAILMLNLFEQNRYFPVGPLSLNRRKLKKIYDLELINKFQDNQGDTIYVIGYRPKIGGNFFEGELWVNIAKMQFIKVTLNCNEAVVHPFLPLTSVDKITKVDFQITQSFSLGKEGRAVFKHSDFDYRIFYNSRHDRSNNKEYAVDTKVLLYAYDLGVPFDLPFFDFEGAAIGDYRKINALPYNEFYWNLNNEYRLNDSLNSNEIIYSDQNTVRKETLFRANSFSSSGLFEHPYVQWTPKRISFRQAIPDSIGGSKGAVIQALQYNLSVKLFADINTYGDSTHVLTAAIFDPYESFYHLPMDNQSLCFINLYFDLWEIKRRELALALEGEKHNRLRCKEIYETLIAEHEKEMEVFLKAVQRGTVEDEMTKYNRKVREKLGIDNIALFNPYPN